MNPPLYVLCISMILSSDTFNGYKEQKQVRLINNISLTGPMLL